MGLKEQWDEGTSVHRDRIDVTGFNKFYAAFVRLTIRALVDDGYIIVDTPAYRRLTRIAGGQETFFPPGEEFTSFAQTSGDLSPPSITVLLASTCESIRLLIGPWTGTGELVDSIQFGTWMDATDVAPRRDPRITSLDEATALEARAREVTEIFAALHERNLLGPKTFTFPAHD